MSQMLYRKGSEIKVNNLWDCDTIVADNETEVAELLKEGWHKTALEACVPEKDREAVLAAIVKKSARLAEANAAAFAAQGIDPTGSHLLNG